MDNNYHLLDLTVYGRQEKWGDSPAGLFSVAQSQYGAWSLNQIHASRTVAVDQGAFDQRGLASAEALDTIRRR